MRKKSATVAKPAPPQPTEQVSATGPSGTGATTGNGKSVSSDDIRLRAYQKWEAAGRPGGDGINFWVEAERELLQAQ